MLIKDCENCKYCVKMVSAGLGVRCRQESNQKYKNVNDKHQKLPVIISNIPKGCKFKI